MVEVVDNLRAAGVDNIGLITELDAKAKKQAADAPAFAPGAGAAQ